MTGKGQKKVLRKPIFKIYLQCYLVILILLKKIHFKIYLQYSLRFILILFQMKNGWKGDPPIPSLMLMWEEGDSWERAN